MRRHMASPCRSVSYHPVPQTGTEFPNFRIDQPQDWKYYKRIFGGVSSVEAKDSSERNYQRQGRDLTTGRLHKATRFRQIWLVGRVGNDFNSGDQLEVLSSNKSFPKFWPAKWLKRNVSMLSKSKQKFVCRRVVNYLNTLQTKAESHMVDLGIIPFQNWEKGVLIVSIFYLIFEFTLYMPF